MVLPEEREYLLGTFQRCVLRRERGSILQILSRMLLYGEDDKDNKSEENDRDRDFRSLCITSLLERVLLGLESKMILISFDDAFSYLCRRATSLGSIR